jgi:hypothetical protein
MLKQFRGNVLIQGGSIDRDTGPRAQTLKWGREGRKAGREPKEKEPQTAKTRGNSRKALTVCAGLQTPRPAGRLDMPGPHTPLTSGGRSNWPCKKYWFLRLGSGPRGLRGPPGGPPRPSVGVPRISGALPEAPASHQEPNQKKRRAKKTRLRGPLEGGTENPRI